MKRLSVSETEYTPALDFDPNNLVMQFKGIARPENVGLFFRQIVDWIDDFKEELLKKAPATLKILFVLEYCNSTTQKYILITLEKLIAFKTSGIDIQIEWHYEDGDEKMLEDGEDISDALEYPIEYIVV